MKELLYDKIHTTDKLDLLNETLAGVVDVHYDISTLKIDPSIGKGTVRHIMLQGGLQTFDFDLKLKNDIQIPIGRLIEDSLLFLYSLEGTLYHQFDSSDKIRPVEQFQTAVMHSDMGLPSKILVKKNAAVTFNIICIDKKEYFEKINDEENFFGKKLQGLLYDVGKKSKHFHRGNYNLKIAEQLKLLIGIEHTNEISELLSQKGRYYLILAKHIEQFQNEIENKSNTSGLLKKELKKISELGDFIKENPEIQHCIKSLCSDSGLSPAKLQEGFKFIYDRTVSDFVRNVRLEKAEKLIRSTDLTISEIVYTVGLTSRSYFCKIFKKRYGCSPKEYKNDATDLN